MRVGEVLKLTPENVIDQKLILRTPKSEKEVEIVFIPRRVADRLNKYIRDKGIKSGHRIFRITYAGARLIVKKAGNLTGTELRPHDLRRHAATYASRSGVPIKIMTKVILRHANLSTTQRYLGKISDTERQGGLKTSTANLNRLRGVANSPSELLLYYEHTSVRFKVLSGPLPNSEERH